MNPKIKDIVRVIEEKFEPQWQYDFDNSGWQILLSDASDSECTGVMLCVDVTPAIIQEAKQKGCNLIVAHHPLIFKPLRNIMPLNRVGRSVLSSIREGISIYSCHTPCDVASDGVSYKMAERLGLKDVEILSEDNPGERGLGVIGELSEPYCMSELIEKIKQTFSSKTARCSGDFAKDSPITRIALGGGACSDLIPDAIRKGAQVFVTSDVKHNLFLDYSDRIILVDLGHYETEECTKEIFYSLLTKKFPNFVLYYSQTEKNPITYL